MKKIVWLSLFLSLLLVSASSAEYLTTANCLPQGKWGLSAAYLTDSYGGGYRSSAFALTGSNAIGASGYGVFVSYGLRDNLELGLSYGLGTVSGDGLKVLVILGGGTIAINSNSACLSLKYGIKQEEKNDPFSLIAGLIAKQGTITTTMPTALSALDSVKTTNSYTIGLLASKAFIPFIPYAGVGYELNSYNKSDAVYGGSENSFGVVLGSAIFLSEKWGTFVEASSRNYNPEFGGGYNVMEYAARVVWLVN